MTLLQILIITLIAVSVLWAINKAFAFSHAREARLALTMAYNTADGSQSVDGGLSPLPYAPGGVGVTIEKNRIVELMADGTIRHADTDNWVAASTILLGVTTDSTTSIDGVVQTDTPVGVRQFNAPGTHLIESEDASTFKDDKWLGDDGKITGAATANNVWIGWCLDESAADKVCEVVANPDQGRAVDVV